MSINRGMDKEMVNIYSGLLLSHKKEWNNAICSNKWIDLEIVVRSEVSQTEKDKYNITYMWNLKKDTNELIYKTEINPQT